MENNHEQNESLVQADDFTLPENEDIYYDPEEVGKKRRHILPVIISLAVIIALVGVVAFIDIVPLRPAKQWVSGALEKITVMIAGDEKAVNRVDNILSENGLEKETNVMPFENAAVARCITTDEGIIIARSNYIAKFDSKGNIKWESATSISEPVLDAAGDYIVLADKDGTGICLYNKNKLIFSEHAENPIMQVDLSEEGDVVVATDKEYSKGAVEAFNKTGRRIFSWTSGSEYVMSVAISDSKRRVAVSLLSTEESAKTGIQFFDISDAEPYYKALFNNSAVMAVEFVGTTLDVTADNCLAGLKIGGDTKWINEYADRELLKYGIDLRGNKIVSVERDAVPYIHIYTESGKLLKEEELAASPDYVDIFGRSVLYNQGRDVYFGSAGSEKKFTASMDVKNLKIIDSHSFLIVYNNSLEFVRQ